LKKYARKCAATGSTLTEILVAGHIVPWSEATEEERLDVNNGILLSPLYDALFDRRLISFNDDGSLAISKVLQKEEMAILNLNPALKINVTEEMKHYLRRHRENLR
jgi:predicted restriction endonuclease